MRRATLVAILVTMALIGAFSGCGSSSDGEASGKSDAGTADATAPRPGVDASVDAGDASCTATGAGATCEASADAGDGATPVVRTAPTFAAEQSFAFPAATGVVVAGKDKLVVNNTSLDGDPGVYFVDEIDVSTDGGSADAGVLTTIGAVQIALADFNGDKKADLVLDSNTAVMIALGDGTGTFGAFSSTPDACDASDDLVTGDVNGDGNQDVIVCCARDDTFHVLLGNGAGALGTAVSSSEGASHLTTGDVNGDGKLDLVVGGPMVLEELGAGDGTFAAPAAVANLGTNTVTIPVLADTNGDGLLDLVTAGWYLHTLRGRGTGGFGLDEDEFFLGMTINSNPAVADMNGDKIPDIVVYSAAQGAVEVFVGNGDGSFAAARMFAIAPGNAQANVSPTVTLGDVDGDGKIDVLVTGVGEGLVLLLNTTT